jgi:hypothetical protein
MAIRSISLICLVALALHFQIAGAFFPFQLFGAPHRVAATSSSSPQRQSNQQPLYSGKGIATDYTWEEEAFELEVTVKVPKDTRAKDIHFKATATSIDLRLNKDDGNGEEEVVLLDSSRTLRGRVVLDGTFWAFSDATEGSDEKEVTVTIEKKIKTAKDDFEVIEYDWKGVYNQDEEEVSFRKYDEPEPLDVREYAASLGVDIDNINMSHVDKTMFTSGLNLTKSSLDSLHTAGLVKEVTQQEDGTEWSTDEDGYKVPFTSMGDNVSAQEVKESVAPPKIPFIDTDSPWQNTVPVDKKETVVENGTPAPSETAKNRKKKKEQLEQERRNAASDPIEALTVARLKEVLRARGLKVSGNKKELQDRLKSEVQSMLTNDSGNDTTVII